MAFYAEMKAVKKLSSNAALLESNKDFFLMQMLLTSPDSVLVGGSPCPKIARVLTQFAAEKNPVALLSNHPEPGWFDGVFGGTSVQFLHCPGRQDGKIIQHNLKELNLQSHDALVLASKKEDVHMAKNGRAVVIGAGWSQDSYIANVGIQAQDPSEFARVISLTAGWNGGWWFSGQTTKYSVYVLSDLSQLGRDIDQQLFAAKVKNTVKGGGVYLNALLTVTARSLLFAGIDEFKDLFWGVYPSSNSDNTDDETLSDFTHRLRTTVSRVQFTKRGKPLFIRHTASAKRSSGNYAGDRRDPTGQVTSLHLNPIYKRQLIGRHIVLVDDCTTYGVSFGVASAFLRKAGAASVTCVALGKFGGKLHSYEIEIKTSPFLPVRASDFTWSSSHFDGTSNSESQNELARILSETR